MKKKISPASNNIYDAPPRFTSKTVPMSQYFDNHANTKRLQDVNRQKVNVNREHTYFNSAIVVKISMLVCATGFFPPCENLFLIVLRSVKSNFLPHRSERKLWSPKMGAMLGSRNTTLKHNSKCNCIQNHSLNMGSHASNGSKICVRVVTKSCVCKRFAKMAPNHFRYFGWIPAYMPCVLI